MAYPEYYLAPFATAIVDSVPVGTASPYLLNHLFSEALPQDFFLPKAHVLGELGVIGLTSLRLRVELSHVYNPTPQRREK